MEVRTKSGAFSWNELLAKDVEAAKSFYTQLFGWTTEDMPSQSGTYTVFKVDGEQVAGLFKLPEQAEQMGAPPYWGSYVTVDNVDETVKKAEELGATVLMPPMDAPGVGRFATVQDPQGAVISFITYEQS
jgi:hypothetical protein